MQASPACQWAMQKQRCPDEWAVSAFARGRDVAATEQTRVASHRRYSTIAAAVSSSPALNDVSSSPAGTLIQQADTRGGGGLQSRCRLAGIAAPAPWRDHALQPQGGVSPIREVAVSHRCASGSYSSPAEETGGQGAAEDGRSATVIADTAVSSTQVQAPPLFPISSFTADG